MWLAACGVFGLGSSRVTRELVLRLLPGNRWCLPELIPAWRGAGDGPVSKDGHGDQFPQRPCQIALGDPDDLVVDADLVDGPASLRPVRRRLVQASLFDEVPAPASVAMPGGIQHATADAAVPAHLGDYDPHLGQSVVICRACKEKRWIRCRP